MNGAEASDACLRKERLLVISMGGMDYDENRLAGMGEFLKILAGFRMNFENFRHWSIGRKTWGGNRLEVFGGELLRIFPKMLECVFVPLFLGKKMNHEINGIQDQPSARLEAVLG